tara:strand:+ start:671 stop:1231 length:561 start_codon:yes stop_codon:yes gene_type:complete
MAFATIDVTKGITGTIPVANGGTGLASGTSGQFLKFTGSTTIASAADNGKIGQVASTVWNTETSTTSSSWSTTGHSVTITPVATSSKILIIFNMADGYVNSGNYNLEVRPYSSIGGATAAQASSQTPLRVRYNVWTGGGGYNFLYSPNTTSSVQILNYFKVNGTGEVYYHNETSKGCSLTVMEILA